MEFLLSGLKRLFDLFGESSNWLADLAITFPGTLYCFKKQLGVISYHVTCRKGTRDRELVRKRVLRENTKIESAREKYYNGDEDPLNVTH